MSRAPNQRDFIERSLAHLASLPAKGGSDMDAVCPTQAALKAADALLKAIGTGEGLPEPTVVATPDRGVEFEWRKGQRLFAVNLAPDGSVEILRTEGVKVVEESSLSHVNGRIAALFGWIGEARSA